MGEVLTVAADTSIPESRQAPDGTLFKGSGLVGLTGHVPLSSAHAALP